MDIKGYRHIPEPCLMLSHSYPRFFQNVPCRRFWNCFSCCQSHKKREEPMAFPFLHKHKKKMLNVSRTGNWLERLFCRTFYAL